MRTHWLLATILLSLVQQVKSQSHDFTLQGQVTGATVPFLYLKYVDVTGKEVQDSSAIVNNTFAFKGKISEPTRAIFKAYAKPVPDENPNFTPLYLEPTAMQALVAFNHFREIKVVGSKTHRDYDSLEAKQIPIRQEMLALRHSLSQLSQKQAGNEQAATQKGIDSLNKLLEQSTRKLQFDSPRWFIDDHPDSFLSVDYLNMFKSLWPIDTVRLVYNRLTGPVKQGRAGQEIANKIRDRDRSAIGTTAFNFSGIDAGGKPITLENFKGRYVLLDFWGSWCGPCRAGNPHLIELYSKHRNKGIEFIGIACDDTPAAWRKAIEKDKIGHWKHLMDGELRDLERGNKLRITKQYAVDSFPTKILINPAGIILGRYGNSQEDNNALDKKLDELFH